MHAGMRDEKCIEKLIELKKLIAKSRGIKLSAKL
jgi:hypothetical protein